MEKSLDQLDWQRKATGARVTVYSTAYGVHFQSVKRPFPSSHYSNAEAETGLPDETMLFEHPGCVKKADFL